MTRSSAAISSKNRFRLATIPALAILVLLICSSGLGPYENQQILFSMVQRSAIDVGILSGSLPDSIQDPALQKQLPYQLPSGFDAEYWLEGEDACIDANGNQVFIGSSPVPVSEFPLRIRLTDASALSSMREVTHLGHGIDNPTTEMVEHFHWYGAQFVGDDFHDSNRFERNLALQRIFNHVGVASMIMSHENGYPAQNLAEVEEYFGYERNSSVWNYVNEVTWLDEVQNEAGNLYFGHSGHGNIAFSLNLGSVVLTHEFGARTDGSTGASTGFAY